MNAQPINDMGSMNPVRSMNSYLQHQSRKSTALFEGNGHIGDLIEDRRHEQEMAHMEAWLQRSRDRIEKAIIGLKMTTANAAQFDDDDAPHDTIELK